MHDKRRSFFATLGTALGAIALAAPGMGQPCPPSAPPTTVVTGYAAATPAHAFTSIAGAPGTLTVFTGTVDDDITTPAPFPFPFTTFDGPATTYQISANGFVDFNQSYFPGFFFGHPPIPAVGQPNGWGSPWYDDLLHTTVAPASNTYMRLSGTMPNRVLTVEWKNLMQFPNTACPNGLERITSQMIMRENGSVIEFRYDPLSFNLGNNCWAALIGVEDLAGAQGIDPTGAGPFNATIPATDFVLTPTLGPGPPPAVLPTYFVSTQPPTFTSIVGNPAATTVFGPGPAIPCIPSNGICPDDCNSAVVLLPFPFDFFTVPELLAVINVNGFLTLDSLYSGTGFTNIFGPAAPNKTIAPFWDDLILADPTSQIAHLTAGTAPNRQFIVEWNNVSTWDVPAGACTDTMTRFSFQAVLKEGSNDIEFRYGPSIPAGTVPATASIGVEDMAGTNFVDATGMGSANSMFPATNLRLDPCEPCGDIKPFGAGCPTGPAGGGGIPVIGTSGGAPTPGNLGFAVTQSSGTPSAPTALVIGLSKNSWLAFPLPLNLPLIGLGNPSCFLNVSLDILNGMSTNGAGAVSFPVPIPASVSACAAQVYFQWADLDLSLLPAGFIAMSRGLWVTIG